MKTIHGVTSAWLASYSIEFGYSPEQLDNLSFAESDMSSQGWVKVGQAEITVHLLDNTDMTKNQIDMLNEAKRRLQAETEAKITAIDGKIQSLLAIEYQP